MNHHVSLEEVGCPCIVAIRHTDRTEVDACSRHVTRFRTAVQGVVSL
jgi:hypothetical protein